MSTTGETAGRWVPAEQLTAALTATWTAIQRNHSEVPPVVFTLGSSPASELCHDRGNHWPRDGAIQAVHQLTVGGGVLRKSPRGVLASLLHAAAHGIAAMYGINETSRRGQYHNKKFVELAEQLQLRVDDAGVSGWASTEVPEEVAETYGAELGQLSTALAPELNKLIPEVKPDSGPGRSGKILAVCSCSPPYRIWAAARTLAEARPVCSQCGEPFTAPAV
uniref:hypothetical protein n=1 Tax=Amycolatopsis sp. CA-290885 TaxID=3239925 RepID=UPI003F494405